MREIYLIAVLQLFILSNHYVASKVTHHHHHHHNHLEQDDKIGITGLTDKRGFLDDIEDLWDSLFDSKKKEMVPVVPSIVDYSGIKMAKKVSI